MADCRQPDVGEAALETPMRTIRAAFHAHSAWSYDASMPLREVAALFRRTGYDAVFMCEHDRGFTPARLSDYVAECARESATGPLLIPGIEYADPDDRVHVPVWGDVPFLGEGVSTARLLAEVAEHRGVSVLAHPARREAWKVFETDWLTQCTGIEIWTRKWDGWAPNPRACRWAAGNGLVGIAALDLHLARQAFPLAMELQVASPLSAEACIEALRRGECRAMLGRIPAERLSSGGLGVAAGAIERVRRPVWRQGGRMRERLRSLR